MERSEEVNPVEVPELAEVPVELQDDTELTESAESSVMSDEYASNVLFIPIVGQFEFIEKIPRKCLRYPILPKSLMI